MQNEKIILFIIIFSFYLTNIQSIFHLIQYTQGHIKTWTVASFHWLW